MGPMGPMPPGMMGPMPPGVMGPMPPGVMGPMGPMPPMPPAMAAMQMEMAANEVGHRWENASARHRELVQDLNMMRCDEYQRGMRKSFTSSFKANLDQVDWRVPRLMYCKDPKWNLDVMRLPPEIAHEVQQKKMIDGRIIEDQMSREAYGKAVSDAEKEQAEAYRKLREEQAKNPDAQPVQISPFEHKPPAEEIYKKPGVPFIHAVPYYDRADDLWQRRLELRSMDEAMNGDVSQPLPRPVIFDEEFENFKQGKYVKDDCPIA